MDEVLMDAARRSWLALLSILEAAEAEGNECTELKQEIRKRVGSRSAGVKETKP